MGFEQSLNILLLKFLESQLPAHFDNIFNNILNRILFNPPLGVKNTIRPEFPPHTAEVCRRNFLPRFVDGFDCIKYVGPLPELFKGEIIFTFHFLDYLGKSVSRVISLESGNNALIHQLDQRGCVWRHGNNSDVAVDLIQT